MPVHPTAIVDPRAEIHPEASIGPKVVVEGPVRVAAGCQIAPFVMLLGHTELGPNCRVHARAVVGDLPQDLAYSNETSTCRIGADCTIREGVTIHRGTGPDSATIVGDRCFLMTNCHIGHNCILGNDVTLVSGCLLGGHVTVGDRAVISENTAVHQFVRIGELAMVSGMAKITQDVPPFFLTDPQGNPAGVNRVGMSRAIFNADECREIKEIYRLFCRSDFTHRDLMEHLTGTVTTSAGNRLLQFLASPSKRGVARDARKRKRTLKT